MEQTARHDVRTPVPPGRRWYMLAVIDMGCRRHLQERADVLAAYVRRQFCMTTPAISARPYILPIGIKSSLPALR